MQNKTLVALFDSNKQDLEKKLENLSLPQDAQKIQEIVSGYLNNLLDSEGDFRQNLTQSEDYILQAAYSLLNSQQKVIAEIAAHSTMRSNTNSGSSSENPEFKKELFAYPLGGSAAGGVLGGLLVGTWGAVFGAIAGTAVALYYISSQQQVSKNITLENTDETENIPQKEIINTEIFLNIVQQICKSVDELITTYRAQIKKVIDKYENMEKPTLENNYRFLLEGVQSLVGYKRTHDENDDKIFKKLQERIEDLAESLENYNLTFMDYAEEFKNLFVLVPNDNVTQTVMVYPAILNDGHIVLQGKAFIPT